MHFVGEIIRKGGKRLTKVIMYEKMQGVDDIRSNEERGRGMFQSGFMKLQRLGMARRKKEIRHMRVMTGLIVMFLALTLLFQDNMKSYQMEINFQNYGEWFLRVPQEVGEVVHPYIQKAGTIWSGSELYVVDDVEESDTVSLKLSKDKYFTDLLLGTMNQQTAEMANIQVYEGYMPKSDDEIVLEINALHNLGYDYELGQEISFYISEDSEKIGTPFDNTVHTLHKKTYILCGMIKSYTTQWAEGNVLPSAIVTESEYNKLSMSKKKYDFYQIKEEYEDSVDIEDLRYGLMQWIQKEYEEGYSEEGEVEVYDNSPAYEKILWSGEEIYQNMKFLLAAMGVFAMGYLMSSYLSRRRADYYKLREIGATVMQVQQMAVFECLYSVLPVAFVVLILSYIGSVGIVWCVAKITGITFFYVFKAETLLTIISLVLLVFGCSVFIAVLGFGVSLRKERQKEVSVFAQRRLKRRAKWRRCRLGTGEFIRRKQIRNPATVWFVRLTGILTCVAVMACLMQIKDPVEIYKDYKELYSDYSITTGKLEYEINYLDGGISWRDIWDMSMIFPESMLSVVEELSGVEKISYYTVDQTHVFDWEGKEESELYKAGLEMTQSANNGWKEFQNKGQEEYERIYCSDWYAGFYFRDFASMWKYFEKHLNAGSAAYDKICRGEQIILVVNDMEDLFEEGKGLSEVTNLAVGDTIEIKTEGNVVPIEVAGIVSMEDVYDKISGIEDLWGKDFCIFGSDVLGERIAKEDGEVYGYNGMNIMLNDFADGEATGSIISEQCSLHNMICIPEWEFLESAYREMVQGIALYGTLAGIILIISLFIMYCVLKEERRRTQKERNMLHQLGMSFGRIRRMQIVEGIRSAICVCIGAAFIWFMGMVYSTQAGYDAYMESCDVLYSVTFDRVIVNPDRWTYTIHSLLDSEWNISWILVFLAVMMIIIILLYYLCEKKSESITCRKMQRSF